MKFSILFLLLVTGCSPYWAHPVKTMQGHDAWFILSDEKGEVIIYCSSDGPDKRGKLCYRSDIDYRKK